MTGWLASSPNDTVGHLPATYPTSWLSFDFSNDLAANLPFEEDHLLQPKQTFDRSNDLAANPVFGVDCGVQPQQSFELANDAGAACIVRSAASTGGDALPH